MLREIELWRGIVGRHSAKFAIVLCVATWFRVLLLASNFSQVSKVTSCRFHFGSHAPTRFDLSLPFSNPFVSIPVRRNAWLHAWPGQRMNRGIGKFLCTLNVSMSTMVCHQSKLLTEVERGAWSMDVTQKSRVPLC